MRLSLKTRFTLATSLLVFAVVDGGFGPVHRAADAADAAASGAERRLRRAAIAVGLPQRHPGSE